MEPPCWGNVAPLLFFHSSFSSYYIIQRKSILCFYLFEAHVKYIIRRGYSTHQFDNIPSPQNQIGSQRPLALGTIEYVKQNLATFAFIWYVCFKSYKIHTIVQMVYNGSFNSTSNFSVNRNLRWLQNHPVFYIHFSLIKICIRLVGKGCFFYYFTVEKNIPFFFFSVLFQATQTNDCFS